MRAGGKHGEVEANRKDGEGRREISERRALTKAAGQGEERGEERRPGSRGG